MSEGTQDMVRVESASQGQTQSPEQTKGPVKTEPDPMPPLPVLPSLNRLNTGSRMKPRHSIRGNILGAAIGLGLGTASLFAADKAGVPIGDAAADFADRLTYSQPVPEKEEPAIIPTPEILHQRIDREIQRIQRGTTVINKFDVANRDEIRFRRDATTEVFQGTEQSKPDNRVLWDSIKSVNGVELGNAMSFTITDAPIVEGQPVDEAGQGFWWIIFDNVELKNGEKTTLYVSRSKKTENIVQVPPGIPQLPAKDSTGKIDEPNMGKISVPAASK
jgi:hypothetical protein